VACFSVVLIRESEYLVQIPNEMRIYHINI
jgi:hypothetical protein